MPISSPLVNRFFQLILILAPIPFGCARPWSWSMLALAVGLCLGAYALSLSGSLPVPWCRYRRAVILYGLVLCWAVFQTLPIVPDGLADPLWIEARAVFPDLAGRISITPAAGWESILRLITYGGAFFLAMQLGRQPRFAQHMVRLIALSGGVFALYGIIVYVMGNEYVLWFRKTSYTDSLTATFINRNHYATMAGIGLLCSLTMIKYYSFSMYRMSARQIPYFASTLCLITALLLTHSRAGVIATCLGIAGLYMLGKKKMIRIIPLGVLTLCALLLLGDRLDSILLDAPDRLRVYEQTLTMLSQSPWFGGGLGSFADRFTALRPIGLVQIWDHAHNDWLEMLADLGIPAAGCLFVCVIGLVWRCVLGAYSRHRDQEFPILAGAAALLVGSHAMLDFSLQIPAVAITFAVLLGIGVAQSYSSRSV